MSACKMTSDFLTGCWVSIPSGFYPAVGRVVAVCALLENRAQSLTEILARLEQGTLTQKPIRFLRDAATASVERIDFANQLMMVGPISPRVNDFYAQVEEIMDRRNAVVHALWPAQSGEAQFGWRPGKVASDGEVRMTQDNTRAGLVDLIGNAVAMVDEGGDLISITSFAVSRALEAGYSGI